MNLTPNIKAHARALRAAAKTSLASTTVPDTPPIEMGTIPIQALFLSKSIILNSSWRLIVMLSQLFRNRL